MFGKLNILIKNKTNNMKLNNKQIEVIKKKIIFQIDAKNQLLVDDYEKNILPTELKKIKSSVGYKEIEKLLKNPLVKYIRINQDKFKELLGIVLVTKQGYTADSVYLEDLPEYVSNALIRNFKKEDLIKYKSEEIEDDIILSTVDNITDIDVLINSIVSKY